MRRVTKYIIDKRKKKTSKETKSGKERYFQLQTPDFFLRVQSGIMSYHGFFSFSASTMDFTFAATLQCPHILLYPIYHCICPHILIYCQSSILCKLLHHYTQPYWGDYNVTLNFCCILMCVGCHMSDSNILAHKYMSVGTLILHLRSNSFT